MLQFSSGLFRWPLSLMHLLAHSWSTKQLDRRLCVKSSALLPDARLFWVWSPWPMGWLAPTGLKEWPDTLMWTAWRVDWCGITQDHQSLSFLSISPSLGSKEPLTIRHWWKSRPIAEGAWGSSRGRSCLFKTVASWFWAFTLLRRFIWGFPRCFLLIWVPHLHFCQVAFIVSWHFQFSCLVLVQFRHLADDRRQSHKKAFS